MKICQACEGRGWISYGAGENFSTSQCRVCASKGYKATEAEQALIEGIKAHALANYEAGGWDVIVECWEDADIAREIIGARTLNGAIKKMSTIVSIFADREADATNSAF